MARFGTLQPATILAVIVLVSIARRVPMYRFARRGITLAILLPPAVFTLLDR